MTNGKQQVSGDNAIDVCAGLIRLQYERLKAVKQIIKNFKKDSTVRKTKTYFTARLEKLESISKEFSNSHETIICSQPENNGPYFEKDVSSEFEEIYLEAICLITDSCEELFPSTSSNAIANKDLSSQTDNSAMSTLPSVKLPHLPVPSFTGNFLEWPAFFDAFTHLVHENPQLSAIQKFHFLKQALPTDRDVDILQMTMTDLNYATAWALMVKRYNNPRILFMHHMNTLFNLPLLPKERSEDIKLMLNVANVCLNAFTGLNIPIAQCDHWLAYYLSTRLSKETHQAWEHHMGSNTSIPTFKNLESFLNDRLITLDVIENRHISYEAPASSKPNVTQTKFQHNSYNKLQRNSSKIEKKTFHAAARSNNAGQTESCFICNGAHIVRRCPTFLSKDCFERKAYVDKAKLCLNCLSKSHTMSQCTSTKNCLQCGQRHHTLIHFPQASKTSQQYTSIQPSTSLNPSCPAFQNRDNQLHRTSLHDGHPGSSPTRHQVTHTTQLVSLASSGRYPCKVILATALIVLVNEETGQSSTFRALVDQGSESTIISERAVQLLGLKRTSTSAEICGVGQGSTNQCRFTVSFMIKSCVNQDFSMHIDTAYVLSSLTTELPSQDIEQQNLPHLYGLALADPWYYKSNKIDLIIGVDIFANIIQEGTRLGQLDQPIAQRTQLGWILSGKAVSKSAHTVTVRCHHASIELEDLVSKFYELESVSNVRAMSTEDQWCEEFFKKTHTRQSNGKFLVRLPLKSWFDPTQTLGRSRQLAQNRFYHLERRLNRDENFYIKYANAINDYFVLNQIVPAPSSEDQTTFTNTANKLSIASCVLPHHAVIKEESATTKMRIVFDASAKTSNGKSLNDLLCIGPTLQNDLPAVILNWRLHKYVFASDIQKMYRCIDMHPDDAQYQRILWRNEYGNLQEYCLTTVTFGTASAPYTAIRVIHQIAENSKHEYPLAEQVLKHDIYVDDVQTGSHSVETALEIRDQVISALQSAGMELRKWSSNSSSLLLGVPEEHQSSSTLLQLNSKETVKTLGLCWQPSCDLFTFKLNFKIDPTPTKRAVLSTIARLFDPLGYITPVIVVAKILLKSVWTTRLLKNGDHTKTLGWDDELPEMLNDRWQQFLLGLSKIERIVIPRWLNYHPHYVKAIELHVFCDGSSSAYAANVYLRIKQMDGSISTQLITAKSKVTPTKPLTIPRVELCGAVLATTLMKWVQRHFRISKDDIPVYFWTDATVVLHWIHGDINRWKAFIANRIGKILESSSPMQWNYVATEDNPADCATRGLTPSQLAEFSLWWSGPQWLSQDSQCWTPWNQAESKIQPEIAEEKLPQIQVTTTTSTPSILLKFSSLNKLIRVCAYVLRFFYNIQPVNAPHKKSGLLTVVELQKSLLQLVRMVQRETFGKEIQSIHSNDSLPTKSTLISLAPFLDSEYVLRVRGRLRHANISFRKKHPMILPSDHYFTYLVIENSHQNTLHGGIQLTLSNIRQQFWIINSRRTVRNHIRKCIKCFRNKPEVTGQLMGDLPYNRVNPPQRVFHAAGVDYTGAIELKSSKFRGNTIYKGYIAVFICLATKAIHLEAVTGLSTENFLWALQRFIGRRGICSDIYSDCGTNFLGTDRVLKSNHQAYIEEIEQKIIPKLAAQKVQWHFNPPYSPNFGGIWEANVKSVKHHLKRVTDGNRLTYEELSTVLVRIEACLNSRPLCPLTSDPDDLSILTPGHFLTGDALLALPEAQSTSQSKSLCLSQQYKQMQGMVRQFWSRWSSDWLSHLQARPKWRNIQNNLSINDLVIVKDDNLPPNEWVMGRVIQLYPGKDGLVRVVEVRTQHGVYKRSISKICRLPLPNYSEAAT